MKLEPAVFDTDDGFIRLASLIRAFVDQKADHIQIDVVSSDTLRAAQREPDEYRDLVVKVAGYNARFVELYKELQDSIIARSEHGLYGAPSRGASPGRARAYVAAAPSGRSSPLSMWRVMVA